MIIFLHWLRWDLRRFRSALWLWFLGVAGYSLFVGNLNSDLQFANPGLFQWTQPLGIALLVMEFFLLMRLFSSDACAGVQPFWKTRPPSGWVVGLSKIIIAAIFVLGVPLLAWWLVLTITGNGGEMLSDGYPVTRVTWMQRLWWAQALLISLCLLVSSAAQSGWSMAGQMIALTVVGLAIPATRGWLSHGEWFPKESWRMQPPALWLIAAAAVHLFARWRRTPGRMEQGAVFLLPAMLFIGGTALPFLPAVKPSYLTERKLDQAIASQIHVGEPLLMTGDGKAFEYGGSSGMHRRGFPLVLHLEGLPGDCRASAFWQELTLITPEGRRIPAVDLEERSEYISMKRPTGWSGTNRLLPTAGAIFAQKDLEHLGLVPCRIEGVLRLRVEKRREQVFPLQLGVVMRGPAGHIRIDDVPSVMPANLPDSQDESDRLLEGTILTSELTEEAWWWLEHRQHKTEVAFRMRQDRPVTGWFVEPRKAPMTASGAVRSDLPPLRLRRDAALKKLAEWDFHTGWYETLGFTDVPVVLHHLVIPFSGESDFTKERMSTLFPKLTGSESAEEIRDEVKYALHLHRFDHFRDYDSTRLADLLAAVGPGHLGQLLDLLKNEFSFTGQQHNYSSSRRALEDRIVQLLTPESVEAVRKDDILMYFLRERLAAKGFIPKTEARPPGIESKTDAELQALWLEGKSDASEVLAEAVNRGLPWVPEAFAEMANYRPIDTFMLVHSASRALAKLSDFPSDGHDVHLEWLRANGANIRWDPVANRWVLPPSP